MRNGDKNNFSWDDGGRKNNHWQIAFKSFGV